MFKWFKKEEKKETLRKYAVTFCNEVYDDFCKLCDEEWESIKEFQEHPYWTTRSKWVNCVFVIFLCFPKL